MSLAIQSGIKTMRNIRNTDNKSSSVVIPDNSPTHHVTIWTKLVIYIVFLAVTTGVIAYSWSHRFLVEAANAEQSLAQMDAVGKEKALSLSQSKSWQENILPWKAKIYATTLVDARDQNQLRITSELNTAVANTQKNISFALSSIHSQIVIDPESQQVFINKIEAIQVSLQSIQNISQTALLDTELTTVQSQFLTLTEITNKQNLAATITQQFLAQQADVDILHANGSPDFQSFVEYFNQIKDGVTGQTALDAKTFTQLQKENSEFVQPLLVRATLLAGDERARITKEAAERAQIAAEQEKIKAEAELKQKLLAKDKIAPITSEQIAKSLVVDLSDQTLFAYEYGLLVKSSSITSGKDTTPTVLGNFKIYAKQANTYLVGADYRLHVDYWMPFFEGYGIHDAYWRQVFGGEDYRQKGSHGCVNTPDNMVEWVWNWAPVGTSVTVQA